MCMVSNIGAFPYPWLDANPQPPISSTGVTVYPIPQPGSYEFEQLRKEVQELKQLLLAAKKFDTATGQPDCEMDDKIDLLRKLGKYLGVDLESVFK